MEVREGSSHPRPVSAGSPDRLGNTIRHADTAHQNTKDSIFLSI